MGLDASPLRHDRASEGRRTRRPPCSRPQDGAGDPSPLPRLEGQAVPQKGRALRTETTVNDTRDFVIGRRVTPEKWNALIDIGHQINQRLLASQLQACQCASDATLLERVVLPSTHDGLPAPGLRFGEPRTMALLAGLCSHTSSPASRTPASAR